MKRWGLRDINGKKTSNANMLNKKSKCLLSAHNVHPPTKLCYQTRVVLKNSWNTLLVDKLQLSSNNSVPLQLFGGGPGRHRRRLWLGAGWIIRAAQPASCVHSKWLPRGYLRGRVLSHWRSGNSAQTWTTATRLNATFPQTGVNKKGCIFTFWKCYFRKSRRN